MRTPTPIAVSLAWHARALAGGRPFTNDEPQCGFFRRRLVRNGPWVPARIWIEQIVCPDTGELVDDERLRCEVNGLDRDPGEAWLWLAGQPISEAEFNYMTALRAWAAWSSPDHPAARPFDPIDPLTSPIPF